MPLPAMDGSVETLRRGERGRTGAGGEAEPCRTIEDADNVSWGPVEMLRRGEDARTGAIGEAEPCWTMEDAGNVSGGPVKFTMLELRCSGSSSLGVPPACGPTAALGAATRRGPPHEAF